MAEKTPKKKKSEDIFKASELTPLALEYKRHLAKGRQAEADEILEKIIIGSTQMFIRLSQSEGYHRTVDVDRLVSAAQQKVVIWLNHWEIEKGPLFSFFSKPVSGDSLVTLADGSKQRIDEIVDGKLPVMVRSYNDQTGQIEAKRVVGWFKNPAERKEWRKLSVAVHPGYFRVLYLTKDHPVKTQRGYVEADNLVQELDNAYFQTPEITQAGRSAVVGIYLGDGCISRQSYSLGFGHGQKQLDYSLYLADKFNKNTWVGDAKVKGKTYEDISKVCVPLRQIWRDCYGKFSHKKAVDQWLLNQIDEVALAYWYMDDGSRSCHQLRLHCCSFSQKDINKLIGHLKTKFEIESEYVPRKHKRYGDIKIRRESAVKFQALVAPYLLPIFDYKLTEEFRQVPKVDPGEFVIPGIVPVSLKVRPTVGYCNIKQSGILRGHAKKWFTPDFSQKYCIEVEDNHNFFAEGILVRNCSKYAFLSEIQKENQYRSRYHVTSDNLESIFGAEDHAIMQEKVIQTEKIFQRIFVRWGSEQHQSCIRYLLRCIADSDDADGHNKQKAIKGAAFAWGLSLDLVKFFYNWCLMELRTQMYEHIRIPFTEQDLFRSAHSFDHFADLLDILTWDQVKKMIAIMGGTRLKIPTLAQMTKLAVDYRISRQIETSDMDTDSVAQIAKENRRSIKTAQQAYADTIEIMSPDRSGEYELFPH